MPNISVKWIGSSVLGLLGIIILVALIGYITTKDTALLDLVKTFFLGCCCRSSNCYNNN